MFETFMSGNLPSSNCYIIPNRGATSEQLKELGKAIEAWMEDLQVSIKLIHGDDDLRGGELPTPKPFHPTKRDDSFKILQDEMEALAKSTSYRGVFVKLITVTDYAPYLESLERENIIQQLREALPTEAVQDVLVNGQSWNE